MLDDRATHAGIMLDNYADLLALAGEVRGGTTCTWCGPDSPPRHPAELWILDGPTAADGEGAGLLCGHHATEWCTLGQIVTAGIPTPA